jgi:hypothetical protein
MARAVPGVFPNREQAEAAIAELRSLRLEDEDIGIVVPDPGRYQMLDEAEHDALKGVKQGIAFGVPLGTLAGIGLTALALPGLGPIGLGGLLIGVPGGVLWGTMLGGLGGLIARVRWNDDEDRWCEIPLGGAEVLVVARTDDHHFDQVLKTMSARGARCLLDPELLEQARREADA